MADEIDAHLGRRLRRRRRLLGLTQEQLALAVGVRFQQIQKYECGANRISAARLWSLALALETPIGYFYDGIAGSAGLEGKTPPEEIIANERGRLGSLRRELRNPTARDNETAA